MGLIGKITRSFIEKNLREIVTEIYEGGYTKQSRQVLPPGIDSAPLADDQGVCIFIDGTPGKTVSVGVYPDPSVDPGEIRIFSRDSGGTKKAEIKFNANGDIIMDAAGGASANIKADGNIELNGNTDYLVSWTDLNTVMQVYVTAINALFGTKLDGGGTPGAVVLDLSTSQVATVKIP